MEKNNRSNGYIDSLDGAANDKLMMKWFGKNDLSAASETSKKFRNLLQVKMALEQIFASVTGYSDVKVQFNLDTGEIDIFILMGQNM